MRPWGRPVLLWPNLRCCSFQQVQDRTPALWLGAALWRDWGEPLMTLLYHWGSGPRHHHLALSSSSQLPALFLLGRGVEIRNRRKGEELRPEPEYGNGTSGVHHPNPWRRSPSHPPHSWRAKMEVWPSQFLCRKPLTHSDLLKWTNIPTDRLPQNLNLWPKQVHMRMEHLKLNSSQKIKARNMVTKSPFHQPTHFRDEKTEAQSRP